MRARVCATATTILLSVGLASAVAGEIHRCPAPDGTVRYQDRPCASDATSMAAPAARAPSASAVPASPRSATPPRRTDEPRAADTARAADAAPPAVAPLSPDAIPATRASYVARNEQRCREGEPRACAAVTCERSGSLDSPACQEAVGYLKGPGWALRPRTDLFDPARGEDEFQLTCRASGRRATLVRTRGSDDYRGALGTVPRDRLPEAAARFCEMH